MASGSGVVALVRSVAGEWAYSNDYPDRLDPRAYGRTDCSGTVRWAYLEAAGINVGVWTGDQSGAGREIARGHYPSEVPWGDMLPGDIILMTSGYWERWGFDEYFCHVELYCGDGRMIGSPGGSIPAEKDARSWMEDYGCITWMVRRVVEGGDGNGNHDDSEETMQCIIQPNGENKLCYFDGQRVHYLRHPDQVTALDMAYRGCHGRGIPIFQLGTPETPYAGRLLQALNENDPNFGSF